MGRVLKGIVNWVYDAVEDKYKAPTEELKKLIINQNKNLEQLTEKVETLCEHDKVALEADLSIMDDRICFLIRDCRKKGYTTADDRRRITRIHNAYRARGGNHGEEGEFAIFARLPTEEEYKRDHPELFENPKKL